MRALSRILGAASLALAALAPAGPASSQQARRTVDLELVLAVDVSQSMDYDEHALQRMGYVEAFRHQDVINAILSGPHGRVAVLVMEWAGDFEPIDTVPWTILDSEASVQAFADRLERQSINSEQRTSISNALYSAMIRIERNDIASQRQVIDVSGDGANNAGPPVEEARDYVVKRGVTINGLPIMLEKPLQYYDIEHLDRYYKQCVIGGTGAFIAPVFDLRHLAATIRKKLVMEIAGIDVAPEAAPIQFAEAEEEAPEVSGIIRAQLKLPTTRMNCFAGENALGRGGFGGFQRFPDQ